MNSELIERDIIGCMLFDLEVAEKCIIELQLNDFTLNGCKAIFLIALNLYSNNKPVDFVNVCNEVVKSEMQDLDINYIKDIVVEIYTTAHIDSRINELKEQTYRRLVLEYANKLITTTQSKDIAEVNNLLANIPCAIESKKNKSTGVLLDEAIERMLDRFKNDIKPISGNETGFKALDVITGGIKDGEIILITAEPNVGKSILAHQIGINTAKRKQHVISFNFEMNEKQLGDRTTAIAIPFEIEKLKMPKAYLKEIELEQIEKIKTCQLRQTLDNYLHIDTNTNNKTVGYIKSTCKKFMMSGQAPRLIIVDYLQLMDGDGEEWDIAGKNCKALKALASEFNCPIILIASLSKDGKTRGSGQIDFDVDQKYFLKRRHDDRDEKERAKTELQINKNRDGGKGVIDLLFQEKYVRFVEVSQEWIPTNVKTIEEFKQEKLK